MSKRIHLYDSNNVNTYIGFNFKVNGAEGYVTVAAHTKTPLIKEVNDSTILPANVQKIYYLAIGELYCLNGNAYYTLDSKQIDKNEFEAMLITRKEELLNLNIGILANIELDSLSQINNLLYIKEYGGEWRVSEDRYSGQEGYGYGGIVDCEEYLNSRYGFKITRVLFYYKNRGYNLGNTEYEIYSKVKKVAKRYNYSAKWSTPFVFIDNIVNDILEEYGYHKAKCWSRYRYTFDREVKKEIDNNRPVIMNIALGYYGNHTVTVCGYAIYNEENIFWGNRRHNMIQVYDGWKNTRAYIDYEVFAYELLTGYGSFNIIQMK